MLPRLRTLSLDLALAAKSVPCGRAKPRRLLFSSKVKDDLLEDTALILGVDILSELLDRTLLEDRYDASLPRESRPVASLLEPYDRNEVAETHLESGAAPMAGKGVASGGGDSHRSKGVSLLEFVVVMVAELRPARGIRL